jgi:DNA-binding MarR family transcriptional regulator
MDAYLSNSQNSGNNFDPPPILIAGDSEAARARACSTVAMAGMRVADAVPIEQARARIERQGAASALWIELSRDDAPFIDELLDHIAEDVGQGRYSAILSSGKNLIEQLERHALNPDIEVLIDADEAERAAALAVALSRAQRPELVADASADKQAVRLRQLSEEVSRIASTLARLSTGPAAAPRRIDMPPSAEIPEVPVETVRAVIRARRLRSNYFPEELFADPAWDMLLDLLQSEILHMRVPVSSLCIAAAVPATTALRWLKTMVSQGLFVRRADPHDGRRVFVELGPQASVALRRYFAEVRQVAVI